MIARLLRSKAFALTLIVLPGLWPAWPILRHDPSVLADPLKYILHHLGFVACILLAVVLSFTPLVVLFPKWDVARAVNTQRTLVGVSAWAYGALHFTTHLIYEGGPAVLKTDITKPFLLSGLATLTILTVLAATSPNFAVRQLGGRVWKRVHRFAYLAAILAIYHQAASPKVFSWQVVWIFGPLAVLEAARLLKQRELAIARRAA